MIAAPAGEGRTSFVSRDDLADVAAAVLLREDTGLDGQALEVTGPAALTMAEAAAVLTDVTGSPGRVPGPDRRGGLGHPPARPGTRTGRSRAG